MTNQPHPESDNTQPIGQPSPKNDHPDPADAPTMLPAAGGAAGHPIEEAATLPPPSATTGYSAAEDANPPKGKQASFQSATYIGQSERRAMNSPAALVLQLSQY